MCWVGLQSYAQDSDFWQFEGLDTLYRKVEGFGVGLPQEKRRISIWTTPAISSAIPFGTKAMSRAPTGAR